MHRPTRSEFNDFYTMTTRWMDNDMYGHINNVQYYSYFDTSINKFLMDHIGFDPELANFTAFIVTSSCNYFASASYPDLLDVAVKVKRVGNSSLEYSTAVFRQGDDIAVAAGSITHVFVDPDTHKPTKIDDETRAKLEAAK